MTTPNTLKYRETDMFDKHKSVNQGSHQVKESIAMQNDPPVAKQVHSPVTKSAVIGPGIEIVGDVKASVDLKINGHIKGSIVESSHKVEIGESGKVKANISAKMVIIAGVLDGNIAGNEKVLITNTGRVRGNIVAPRVQLEDGALFKGSIEMDPAKVVKQETRVVSKKVGASSRAGLSIKDSGNGTGPAPVKGADTKESGLTLKSG